MTIDTTAPTPAKPVSSVPGLRRKLRTALRAHYPTVDLAVVERAADFAISAHADQTRVSGDPYVTHPLAVAIILAQLGIDPVACAAALLHDVPEDTAVELDEVRALFGPEIALLVDGVTRLSQAGSRTQEQVQAETIRKMLLAMATDVRVVLIKLADRLHNMRTLGVMPAHKRARIARQTLDIYAPLAERLGIWQLKWQLEDLSFAELEPAAHAEVAAALTSVRRSREVYIKRACALLGPALESAGIESALSGRPKHLYSIWRKMVRKHAAFEEIYDAYAVRVIVPDVSDCYAALGIVHAMWSPVPGEFDDYIAMPKPNGYQSLHTAVLALDGQPLEVQIRTQAMHDVAEAGIAAHWRYKEGGSSDRSQDAKLAWLRQLMDWQHEVVDSTEFVEGLKLDLFADRVFVFTPQGDIKDLAAGSGPLDFAYLVHTAVGHRAVGARVNGKIMPFSHKLQNGDIVEILTTRDPNHGPSRDWLKLVRTPHARSKIRAWFKAAQHEEKIAHGRDALERDLRCLARIDLAGVETTKLLDIARLLGQPDLDELYAAIGYGSLATTTVISRLGVSADNAVLLPAVAPKSKPAPTGGVRVAGAEEILTRFAGCCTPVPGDAIVGFVTRGKGVTVHLAACPSIRETTEAGRLIAVEWAQEQAASYPITLRIEVDDRPGILSDLTAAIAGEHINISAIDAAADTPGHGLVIATLAVMSVSQLARLAGKLEGVRGVQNVSRES